MIRSKNSGRSCSRGWRRSCFRTEQGDEGDKTVQDLEAQVAAAKNIENSLYDNLRSIQIENKVQGREVLEVQFARTELDGAEKQRLSIVGHIQQLEYDAKGPAQIEKANDEDASRPQHQ